MKLKTTMPIKYLKKDSRLKHSCSAARQHTRHTMNICRSAFPLCRMAQICSCTGTLRTETWRPSMCLIPASTGTTKPITTAISRLLMNRAIRIGLCLEKKQEQWLFNNWQLDSPLECAGAADFLCQVEFRDKRKPDLQHGFVGRLPGSARTGYQFH